MHQLYDDELFSTAHCTLQNVDFPKNFFYDRIISSFKHTLNLQMFVGPIQNACDLRQLKEEKFDEISANSVRFVLKFPTIEYLF